MRPTQKSTVVIGFLGSQLDAGVGAKRWQRWRPTVSLGQHSDFVIKRLELLYSPSHKDLAVVVADDLRSVSPETEVRLHALDIRDPWALDEVYEALWSFGQNYRWKPDKEDYLAHITTGTHIAQICMFLLTESRQFPARLLQTAPPRGKDEAPAGTRVVIDLDLTRYERLAERFRQQKSSDLSFLKNGIATKNAKFNELIELIEKVAISSLDPLLILGPTGAGKSQIARQIYELRLQKGKMQGDFVEVNCATLRGDGAMSALFGHEKGAFTGAASARQGMLRAAHHGMLFLDELGELGLDEQAMLLQAIETKHFYPLGGDRRVHSDFVLIAGTNRDLRAEVARGKFREDLLARLATWTFRLPGLAERREDVQPNLDFELERVSQSSGVRTRMLPGARSAYLRFAESEEAIWSGNFRDLSASVRRMATLAEQGLVSEALVRDEVQRLRHAWGAPRSAAAESTRVAKYVEDGAVLDRFDEVQLEEVLAVCERSHTLSEAGRLLFAASRAKKESSNDADRLRKYLHRFGIDPKSVVGKG